MNTSQYIKESYSAELQLAIQLCRPANDIVNESDITKLILPTFDWELFIKLCEWHRIIPHIAKHLKEKAYSLPSHIVSYFEDRQKENAMKALEITNELIQINKLFSEKEIDAIFIKGAIVAQQLYGDINGRSYRDIDIQIPLSKIEEAHDILISNNYERTEPNIELSKKQKKYNYKRTHEYAYKHKDNGTQVEIHWRLFTNKYLLPSDEGEYPGDSHNVFINNNKISTLSFEKNIIYLACHGAVHLWFRLFWIRDLSYIISQKEVDWEVITRQLEANSMLGILTQTLLLSKALFNTKIPNELEKYTKSNPSGLLKIPLHAIGSSFTYHHNPGTSKFRILSYRMRLKKNFAYKFRCLSPFATHYNDWKLVRLPDWLFFLYFPLRPFLWIYKLLLGKQ